MPFPTSFLGHPSARRAFEQVSQLLVLLLLGACAALFAYQVMPWVLFPADLLTWSEPGFIGSLIKLDTHAPLYGPPGDNNSPIYTPAAPVLTYWILKGLGQALSVPAARVVQAVFVFIAAGLATVSVGLLRRLVDPARRPRQLFWTVAPSLLMLLGATSPRVNRFVLMLHADALALLFSMVAWIALLHYVGRPTRAKLLVLALIPIIGFTIKQFLISWLPVTLVVLVLLPYERQRDRIVTTALYGAVAATFLALGLGLLDQAMGQDFRFWVFDIMGGTRRRITLAGEFNISLLRGLDHVFQAWGELVIGLGAAAWLTWRSRSGQTFALLAGCVTLLAFEAVSSGSGWSVLYHFGPVVLIGCCWAVVALRIWHDEFRQDTWFDAPARAGLLCVASLTVCVGLRVVPTNNSDDPRWFPGPRPTPELLGQLQRIEQEFHEFPPSEVLVDNGNWLYIPSRVVALDRSEALGDQPPGGRYENFEPLLARIRGRHYRKIMVRSLHEGRFIFDWAGWPRSSGVRQALLEHYREVALLPRVRGLRGMYDGPVSVLVPDQSIP